MEKIPEGFIEEMRKLLGEESDELVASLNGCPITAVRVNTRKPGAEFSDVTPVPWCKSGFYLGSRPEFILDPLLHAGAYYVQDASSMIYESVTERLLEEFKKLSNTECGGDISLQVLDLCASPGGKTTAMINALPDGSRIIANEYTKKRVGALQENIDRWGYREVTVTNRDSSCFADGNEQFDIVAVDAPCSGEGMMRKEEAARTQWSLQLVESCSFLQKEILKNSVAALKPGGFLIYSTCTFNRHENEDNAEFIRDELNMEPFDPDFPKEWGIPRGISTDLPVYRFMPHKTKGEGLFLAVFRKPGVWTPTKRNDKIILEKSGSRITDPNFKNSRVLGSRDDKIGDMINVDVDRATALSYLRGESIVLPPDTPKGIVTITYKGLALGEAKNIGTRANNHYPKNRRILKR